MRPILSSLNITSLKIFATNDDSHQSKNIDKKNPDSVMNRDYKLIGVITHPYLTFLRLP